MGVVVGWTDRNQAYRWVSTSSRLCAGELEANKLGRTAHTSGIGEGIARSDDVMGGGEIAVPPNGERHGCEFGMERSSRGSRSRSAEGKKMVRKPSGGECVA